MNNDTGIICIQHCYEKNIYCINIPSSCPICKKCLQNLLNIPTRVPFPFVRASQQSCCIILKPTQGDFLNNYQLMDNLHIGVTTSKGIVISYNWNGISQDTDNWQECLVAFQFTDHCWEAEWDSVLADLVKNNCWNSAKYDANKHNCFSFIMAFIKQFNSCKMTIYSVETKEDFTELYILPIAIKACKYINLYRQILKNGFYSYNKSTKKICI